MPTIGRRCGHINIHTDTPRMRGYPQKPLKTHPNVAEITKPIR